MQKMFTVWSVIILDSAEIFFGGMETLGKNPPSKGAWIKPCVNRYLNS